MATYRGTDGVIEIEWQGWDLGKRKMTEVQSFSVSVTAAIINDNASSDEWDTHLVGRNSLTGTVSVLYDYIMADIDPETPDYTSEGLVSQLHFVFVGRQITFEFYTNSTPEEETIRIFGSGTITSVEVSNNHDNTPILMQVGFTGTGQWLESAVFNPEAE